MPDLVDPADLLEKIWTWITTSGLRILVILVVAAAVAALFAWLSRRIIRTAMSSSRVLATATAAVSVREEREQELQRQRRNQRLNTLGNVARNVGTILIWAIALVMILSELGVNIAPVIASLGVLGLAAGIGAQTIIKDIVAGIVMLFEDLVAVGDVVDLEYATGTVEEINLRVTQVRSLDGVLWTVRNGEIVRIGNMSRGFSTALVMLDLDSGQDHSLITRVLNEIAQELQNDPEWAPLLLGDVVISGLLRVDGARMQRRLTVRVVPGKQWSVEEEIRQRVHSAFSEHGIKLALPRFGEEMRP